MLFPQILVAIFISLPLASPEASPAALASPDAYASDYGYTYNALPVVEAAPSSQYHAQDDVGQYNYGFSSQDQVRVHLANHLLMHHEPFQTKSEIKTADGVTRGAYSYVDANGIVQTVNYISDAMGFRVAATNLPVHNVEGNSVEPAVVQPEVAYAYLPYAQNYGYAAPAAA